MIGLGRWVVSAFSPLLGVLLDSGRAQGGVLSPPFGQRLPDYHVVGRPGLIILARIFLKKDSPIELAKRLWSHSHRSGNAGLRCGPSRAPSLLRFLFRHRWFLRELCTNVFVCLVDTRSPGKCGRGLLRVSSSAFSGFFNIYSYF